MREISYIVPGMSCGQCEQAVSEEVTAVAGVQAVEVNLAAKLVTVRGEQFDDAAIRAAIEAAGYEVA